MNMQLYQILSNCCSSKTFHGSVQLYTVICITSTISGVAPED